MSTDPETGWIIEDSEQDEVVDPETGWIISDTQEKQPERDPFEDVISKELRSKGYEPDPYEEIERAAELGNAEGMRGLLSGASLGVTENIPGFKPGDNIASGTGKFIGSLLPISKIGGFFGEKGAALAAKSPIFKNSLGALANLVGAGLTGATYEGATELGKGELPSVEEMIEHGIEWSIIDAGIQTLGLGGRFASALASRMQKTNKPSYKVMNDMVNDLRKLGVDFSKPELVASKALATLEELAGQKIPEGKLSVTKKPTSPVTELAKEKIKPQEINAQSLKSRKIEPEKFETLEKGIQDLSESYNPEDVNFKTDSAEISKNVMESQLEQAGERAYTKQELGSNIKKDIESQLEIAKSSYEPLYEAAEAKAREVVHIPTNTARIAGDRLKQLSRLKTKPEGYSSVLKNLDTVLADIGFSVEKDAEGVIQNITSTKEVPLEDLMELGRRLNKIVNYDLIEPSVQNVLKDVVRNLKKDIRIGLADHPEALQAWTSAEAQFADTASRFGRNSVRKIRHTQADENIASHIDSPTSLTDLRQVLSPKQMQQVEREVLEKINDATFDKAKKMFSEVENQLSRKNRKLTEEIIDSKNPYSPNVIKRNVERGVLDEVSNSLATGSRPEKTLSMWKDKKGRQVIKDAFEGSPNWKQVKTYLEKQSFNDMVRSIVDKEGSIDLTKLKEFLYKNGMAENIIDIGGKDALDFFDNLGSDVKRLKRNVSLLDRIPNEVDINKGKELLERQTKTSAKTKEAHGKEILSRAKQKNLEKDKLRGIREEKLGGKGKLSQAARIAEESTGAQGKGILNNFVKKNFPYQHGLKTLKGWLVDTMGLNEKATLGLFTLARLGVPNTVSMLVSYKVLTKMMTSPRVRNAFKKAAEDHNDPIYFIAAWEAFQNVLDED